MTQHVFGYIDGENLVHRYQDMINKGSIPRKDVIHKPEFYVWHPRVTQRDNYCAYDRISFYQTVVGDDKKLNKAREEICKIRYGYRVDKYILGDGSLYPRIFKKGKKESKTKSVDINISVDMLRNIMNGVGDIIFLLSGDGDYLPLIEEVGRHGKQVWLGAFSSGLNPSLRYAADEFIDLDPIFFEKPSKATNQKKSK